MSLVTVDGDGVEQFLLLGGRQEVATEQPGQEGVHVTDGRDQLTGREGHRGAELRDVPHPGAWGVLEERGVVPRMRGGHLRGGVRHAGAAQGEWLDDEPLHRLLVRVARGSLDDHSGEDVVGVGVVPLAGLAGPAALLRLEVGPVGERDVHQLGGGPCGVAVLVECVSRVLGAEAVVHVVVEDPAGVVEQVPYGDVLGLVPLAAHDSGQPPLHAVVQRQPPLGLQLEQHRGGEGLGDAGDAELLMDAALVLDGEVADACAAVPHPVVVPHLGDDARGAPLHDPVQHLLRASVRSRRGVGCCGGSGDDGGAHHAENSHGEECAMRWLTTAHAPS